MSELPLGWSYATLADICERVSRHNPADRPDEPIRYINIGGIDKQRIVDIKELAGRDAPSRARQLVRTGDTVLSTVRTYLRKTALVPPELDGGIASTGFCVLRPSSGIEPGFIFYRVIDPAFVAALSDLQTGSSYPAVRDADVFGQEIAVPPSREQQRIVAAIEENFSRLDAAERLLTDARHRLSQLRSAVLSSILKGPWPLVRIGDVALVGGGATPKRGHDGYWKNGTIPWVTSGQLTEPVVREPAALITEEALRETSVKVWPKHTLLVALYGEGKTRGHCSELLIEATTNQACAAILLEDDSVDRAYLKLFFAASYDAHRRLASGGVQPNLSLGLIKNLTFPLPPIEEQRRIVAKTEQQLSLLDALTEALDRALRRSVTLRRSVLEQAFAGKLVPQDAADEPESALLERIIAARASEPRVSRGRRQVPA